MVYLKSNVFDTRKMTVCEVPWVSPLEVNKVNSYNPTRGSLHNTNMLRGLHAETE